MTREVRTMENKTVRFADLSLSLKTAVVLAYVIGGLYALAFIIGFASVFLK
jgi:hypothetical protein